MESDIEMLVSIAKEGDKKALEDLLLQIQDKIYGLACACSIIRQMRKMRPRKSSLKSLPIWELLEEKAPLAPGCTEWLPITC